MAFSILPWRCVAQSPRLAHRAIALRAAITTSHGGAAAALRTSPLQVSATPTGSTWAAQRPFSACACLSRGIMPETSTPTTKDSPATERKFVATELSDEEYHDLADTYLHKILAKFERLQETREDIDVDYSAGVMTLTFAEKGTFVINKQPPNKQIWLSSPISGPKRYDWCVASEGQGDKEGTATGYWVYARDGTTLDDLVLEETGVDVESPVDS